MKFQFLSSLPSMPPLVLLPNTRFSRSEDFDDDNIKRTSLSSSSSIQVEIIDHS